MQIAQNLSNRPVRGHVKRRASKKAVKPATIDSVNISESKPAGSMPVSSQLQLLGGLQVNLASNLPPTLAQPVAESFKSGFVQGYLTPTTIEEQCEKLAREFPELVEVVKTGIETHGYYGSNEEAHGKTELSYLRIGPRKSDRNRKVGVFQYAAPHARERINPMSMMEFAHQLVHNYDPNSDDPKVKANTALLDQLDIYVAINTNPDGHNFAAFDDDMWRKNRAPLANGEYGVDINRNYPYQWEQSDEFSSEVYSGAGPASEPETQALLKVVKDHPNIRFVVDWHSYGEEIRRPMGTTSEDDKVYDAMHGRVQKAMAGVNGNEYETVISQVTKGSSDDSFYHEQGVYSTVMETGEAFTPPENEALDVMKESVEGAHEYLRVASDWASGKLTHRHTSVESA